MSVFRPIRRLALLAPALIVTVLFMFQAMARGDTGAPAKGSAAAPPPAAPVTPRPAAPKKDAKAEVVTVGCYLHDIPDIDVKTNSFHAELYLWFLWSGDIDPTLSFHLANAVGISELTKTPVYTDASGAPKPEVLPDGRSYQVFHVHGRFGHPFPLAKFPFDDHEIVISLADAKHPAEELVHALDAKGSSVRPDLVIPGWKLNKMSTQLASTRYATNFGDPRATDAHETYSHVEFMVHIERPVSGLLSKTVIPLAIILLMTFGAFFLPIDAIDARLTLTITALMAAVALQVTAAMELPATGYLVLLDKVYILSYAMILAVTLLCIAVNRFAQSERAEQGARLDMIGGWLCIIGYFGGLGVMLARH